MNFEQLIKLRCVFQAEPKGEHVTEKAGIENGDWTTPAQIDIEEDEPLPDDTHE